MNETIVSAFKGFSLIKINNKYTIDCEWKLDLFESLDLDHAKAYYIRRCYDLFEQEMPDILSPNFCCGNCGEDKDPTIGTRRDLPDWWNPTNGWTNMPLCWECYCKVKNNEPDEKDMAFNYGRIDCV